MRLTDPRLLMAIAIVVLAAMTGCASGGVQATGAGATGSASPAVGATASPDPALSIDDVAADLGPTSQNPLWRFAGGHWLYADDLNDTINYDGKVVARGHPVTAALSQNGLHYAYTLAAGLTVYVDGRAVAIGTYLPDVFAVSNDGSTVLYSDTSGLNGPGAIYRNGISVFHAPVGIGEAVGSADAMHYTAVVDGEPSVGTLVHDGRTVATSGITGNSIPMISPDGTHYGLYSSSEGGGVTSVDGVVILPATAWAQSGQITDSGHWALLDSALGFAPLVDGVAKGPPADDVVISADGQEIAEETSDGRLLVNGARVGTAPRDGSLEIDGNTLYVYNIET
jgi:hypothetical protein